MKNIRLPHQKDYPKQITFGLEIYTIVFKKGLKHYGETDPEKKRITIRKGISPRLTMITFIHELLHVIEFEQPIRIKHSLVYELEKGIAEMLMDNFL